VQICSPVDEAQISERKRPIQLPASIVREPQGEATALTPLSELVSGARGVVQGLRGGQRFIGHMAALGFTVDAEVEIIQNLGHGAIIVAVRGTQVALGCGECV
jgi:ferrous iron transport protein A